MHWPCVFPVHTEHTTDFPEPVVGPLRPFKKLKVWKFPFSLCFCKKSKGNPTLDLYWQVHTSLTPTELFYTIPTPPSPLRPIPTIWGGKHFFQKRGPLISSKEGQASLPRGAIKGSAWNKSFWIVQKPPAKSIKESRRKRNTSQEPHWSTVALSPEPQPGWPG